MQYLVYGACTGPRAALASHCLVNGREQLTFDCIYNSMDVCDRDWLYIAGRCANGTCTALTPEAGPTESGASSIAGTV